MASQTTEITFAKDVAPILQKCQVAIGPADGADAAPDLHGGPSPKRAIRAEGYRARDTALVCRNRNQKFKNNAALSDEQLDTIVRWS